MLGPILARTKITRSWSKRPHVFFVCGGLHNVKGNSSPYFALTYEEKTATGRFEAGGAGHDEIEKLFPGRFTDLAAMHLSTIDGVPMYAEANGWYHLAGYLQTGERFHSGNSPRHFADGYRNPTTSECLDIWAQHMRLSREDAQALASRIEALRDSKAMRAEHALVVDEQKARWKQEAEACIAKHSLVVYGDAYEGAI